MSQFTGKDPDAGKDWRQKKKAGSRGWDSWMASLTWCTWVCANSGRWWRTEKHGVLQSMGSQRVRHDWATEQLNNNSFNWGILKVIWHPYWGGAGTLACLTSSLVMLLLCSENHWITQTPPLAISSSTLSTTGWTFPPRRQVHGDHRHLHISRYLPPGWEAGDRGPGRVSAFGSSWLSWSLRGGFQRLTL